MKKQIIFACMALAITVTGCLKSNLDALPAFSDAAITDIFFEYRYEDAADKYQDGVSKFKVVSLSVTGKSIRLKENTGAAYDSLYATVTVPADGFDNGERAKVTATNIVGYTNISTAAAIKPLESAPAMGVLGNYTSPVKYQVTAADGKTIRTWVISIVFIK